MILCLHVLQKLKESKKEMLIYKNIPLNYICLKPALYMKSVKKAIKNVLDTHHNLEIS